MPTVIHAVVGEGFGRAWADNLEKPTVGWAQLDFNFLAGDAAHPAASEIARQVTHAIVPTPQWTQLFLQTWGDRLRKRQRISFRGADLQAEQLRAFIGQLPQRFELTRIDRTNVDAFSMLGPFLVGNFRSTDHYLNRGVGFGIHHGGRFVSGVSSFCIAGRDLEIEIQTHADFRRRGLATIVAARMILHCIEHGITPHWDAHNPPSANLACKLGFRDEVEYHLLQRD